MKLNTLVLTATIACSAAFSTLAAKIGDPAAALAIQEWVKGKKVDVKDGKHVYVVEFWATWCGPCKTSIPHLTEMQKKFKDKGVIFVGISDEKPATVLPFVQKMGDKMDYVVACDEERKSSDGYMQAYGQGGIPTAFIVGKDGKVLWFGHPMAELEATLEKIVAGKYDLKTAIAKDEARAVLSDYQKLSAKGDDQAKPLGRKLLASAGTDIDALCELAFNVAAAMSNKHRDFALANEALDKAEKSAAGKDHRILGTRSVVRFESGKELEGLELAREAVSLSKEPRDKGKYQNFVRVMEGRITQKAKSGADDK